MRELKRKIYLDTFYEDNLSLNDSREAINREVKPIWPALIRAKIIGEGEGASSLRILDRTRQEPFDNLPMKLWARNPTPPTCTGSFSA